MPTAATSPCRKPRSPRSRPRCRRCARRWRKSATCWRRSPGIYPSEGPRKSFRLADLQLPADLPVSVPSQLIEQRPDVRAAEEQMHSASAQIGVATANLLPNFTINGNAGYMNTALASLLAPQNLFWTARRQRDADGIRRQHIAAPACGREGHL